MATKTAPPSHRMPPRHVKMAAAAPAGMTRACLEPSTVCIFFFEFFFNHTNDYLSNYAQAYNPNQPWQIQ